MIPYIFNYGSLHKARALLASLHAHLMYGKMVFLRRLLRLSVVLVNNVFVFKKKTVELSLIPLLLGLGKHGGQGNSPG